MASGAAIAEGRSDKSKIILVGVIILVIIIVAYTLLTGGFAGVQDLVMKLLTYGLILGAIGAVVWIVLKILKKSPVDLVACDKADLIDAALLSKPTMLKDLYFTGDKEHGEFRVGKIVGYAQITSYKDLNRISSLTPAEIDALEKQGIDPSNYLIKEDCFVFKKTGFPFAFFEEPKVLRTLEDEHSQLIGDVKVYAVSMIKKFSYYFPSRAHLDIARIDIAIIREAWRGQIFNFLKDMVSINQRASGLDAEHRKDLENRKLLKLPTNISEQENRQG